MNEKRTSRHWTDEDDRQLITVFKTCDRDLARVAEEMGIGERRIYIRLLVLRKKGVPIVFLRKPYGQYKRKQPDVEGLTALLEK